MKVKIKKTHKDAVIPKYAKPGDAGMDLKAVSKEYDGYGNTVYDTGLAFEIPEGYVGLLFPRSSNSKTDLRLTNSVGVVDSGYRGNVSFKFRNTIPITKKHYIWVKGDMSSQKSPGLNNETFNINLNKILPVGTVFSCDPYSESELIVQKLPAYEKKYGGYTTPVKIFKGRKNETYNPSLLKSGVIYYLCYLDETYTKTSGYLTYENQNRDYNVGDRIGQIVILPYPQIEFEEVEDLTETERGAGGFGSTGK